MGEKLINAQQPLPPPSLRPAPRHAYRPPTPPVAAPPHPHRHHWRPSHRCTPPAASDGHSAHSIPTFPLPLPHPLPYRLPTAPRRRRRPIAPAPPDSATSPALTPSRRPSHPSPVRNRLRASPTAQYRPAPLSLQSAPPTHPPCPTVGHTQASLCDRPYPPCPSTHHPDQAGWISPGEPLPRVAASLPTAPRRLHCP